jgi:glycosyltransferase involved in cell wall biosynthesis
MTLKNILIFGHSYATQFIDINNQYTKLFDKSHYKVTVVYLTGEPNEAVLKKHVANEVIFLNSPKKSVRGLKIDAIKKILALFREKNFEVVITHRYKPTYIMLWIARFHPIPRMVAVMHEIGVLRSLMRKLTVALLAQPNIFFAGVSNAVRNDLQKAIWRVHPEQVITLYNSIDVEIAEAQRLTRDEARQKLQLPDNAFVFAAIGRLAKNKDPKTLIQAYSLIKNQCTRTKLIIIGDGELESDLKKFSESLGIQNDILFKGFVPHASHYMKAFDVFVSTSIQEAFGMVLIEAMLAKIPVIATQVDGIPEVIGQAGLLIEPKNAERLAAEMLKAYQMKTALLAEWGQKGHERVVSCFSLQKFKENFWVKTMQIAPYKDLI